MAGAPIDADAVAVSVVGANSGPRPPSPQNAQAVPNEGLAVVEADAVSVVGGEAVSVSVVEADAVSTAAVGVDTVLVLGPNLQVTCSGSDPLQNSTTPNKGWRSKNGNSVMEADAVSIVGAVPGPGPPNPLNAPAVPSEGLAVVEADAVSAVGTDAVSVSVVEADAVSTAAVGVGTVLVLGPNLQVTCSGSDPLQNSTTPNKGWRSKNGNSVAEADAVSIVRADSFATPGIEYIECS